MPFGGPLMFACVVPDLFGLTEATSNAGACARTNIREWVASMTPTNVAISVDHPTLLPILREIDEMH